MIRLRNLSAGAVPLLLLLSACGGSDIAALKTLQLSGDGYDAALAREYRDFALYEADEMGDRRDAGRFAIKALAAARGENPAPEKLQRWNVPDQDRLELTAARQRLTASLNQSSRRLQPNAAARAVARFDCWVEQLDENFQPAHIAACREDFYRALLKTENPLPRAFMSFFDHDDATLRGDGVAAAAMAITKAIAGETAATVKSVGDIRVVIGGHADRSGGPDHNYRLSLKRAENTRDRLIGLGVPGKRITIRAHGEALPLVKTPDGVPNPRNRRVEISIDLFRRL